MKNHSKGILLILLLAVFCKGQSVDPTYSYTDFMRQFGRNYTGDEKAQHEAIFNSNYAEMQRLKAEGKDLEVNDFMDWN